ncbi:hypothetical protein [Aureimonas sp. AU40]|uniref:hypothetical protein n=1 Tax=Aureimonas sp. AU40 TaxID=1637747 RepID=UPI0007804FCF|nr:hypothetical protein [Aureimonas sp. AU40]
MIGTRKVAAGAPGAPFSRGVARGALALCALLALSPAAPAGTQTLPDYRDDRSTPEAVIESLYNAINRHEFLRAWSYFRDEPDRPEFESFAKGYADTSRVRLKLGMAEAEGAAGSTYYRVPAVVEATRGGTAAVFSGCYELRLLQPGAQAEPPFQPMGIVRGNLRQSKASFEEGQGDCSVPNAPAKP